MQKSSIVDIWQDVWQDSKCDPAQYLIIIAQEKSEEKLTTTGVTHLGLPLPPNSLDLHQQQKELSYQASTFN